MRLLRPAEGPPSAAAAAPDPPLPLCQIRALVEAPAAAGKPAAGAQGVEERAALSVLVSYLDETLRGLEQGRPPKVPEESAMPEFKEPDNTNDAGDDSW